MLQTPFLLPTSMGGVLPTQTQVGDSRCCKRLFFWPIETGESYPPKLKCMRPDVENDYSPAHYQGGSLTHPNSSALLQMLQTTFLLPTSKRGLLLNQIQVHYPRCCKRVYFCPLEKGEFYPPKIQFTTLDVANDVSSAH